MVLGILSSLPAAFFLGLLRLWWWADRTGVPAAAGAAAGGGAVCCLALIACISVLVGEVARERKWCGPWVRLLFDGAYVLGVVIWWAVFLS